MNQRQRLFLGLARLLAVFLPSGGYSADSPISKEQVAELLEYPSANLVLTEQTRARNETAQRKHRPLAISVHSFTASDFSCAPLSVTVGEAGTLLTAELRDYAEKVLATSIGPATGYRKIDLQGVGSGYLAPGSFGPGGDTQKVVLTLLQVRKDIQITLSIPSDGQLVRIPAGARHYALLPKTALLTEKLVRCAEISARSVILAAAASNRQASDRNLPPDGSVVGTQSAPDADPLATPASLASTRWPWGWIIFWAVSVALAVWLYARRR